MRYRRALLVTPAYPGRHFGGVRPPVGIAYVEEFVAQHGVATSAFDMNVDGGFRALADAIRRFRPDLIGMTLMTYQYRSSLRTLDELRRRFPEVAIVVGGPHISATEGAVLALTSSIDYAIAGEGEIALRDLCCGRPYDEIPGLHFRRDGVRAGAPRSDTMDLDAFPFPRYRSYRLERYTNEIEVCTSRGCPHRCIFCSVPNHMGRRVRYRSSASVGDELEYFWRRGVRSFQFGDDNFLANRRRALGLFEEIGRRQLDGAVMRCGQGIRADLLTEEMLVAMKGAGFRHLGIGVESGSDRVLATICKHLDVGQVDRAVERACRHGFDVTLLFVIGTPGETLADILESIRLALKHPVMKAHFFHLVPFPGTPLHDWVTEHDAFLDAPDALFMRTDEWKLRARPFFQTEEMPEADRVEAQRLTARASRTIQVRTLERKLAHWGRLGRLMAQAGRFNTLERLFVRHRRLRRALDEIVFHRAARVEAESP